MAHKFWGTQPIDISKNTFNNAELVKPVNIQQEPYKLPDDFEWYIFDITNNSTTDLTTIYDFLLSYYVDDVDAQRRFHYSKEFLQWILTPPNYYKDLLLGIKYKGKIVATIFGIPTTMKIFEKVISTIEINFLCVHNTLRNKRLTPVLIKEITRRTNLHGINQAFYTTSIDLPNTLVKCSYYHRPLNIQKLLDLNFIDKPEKVSVNGLTKFYKTLDDTTINIRKIEPKDFTQCCVLLNEYQQQFKIATLFNQEEFNAHFSFKPNVIETYVVFNNNNITDLISFYFIPSKITNNKYTDLRKAYLYYYFNTETPLDILVNNGLHLMKLNKIDVVNCVKQYNNDIFIDKLKFREGTGALNYYLFNWQCPPVISSDIGFVIR